jgi:hypothetical protein
MQINKQSWNEAWAKEYRNQYWKSVVIHGSWAALFIYSTIFNPYLKEKELHEETKVSLETVQIQLTSANKMIKAGKNLINALKDENEAFKKVNKSAKLSCLNEKVKLLKGCKESLERAKKKCVTSINRFARKVKKICR